MNAVVTTQKLTKHYEGICRVKELDLQVYEGEIYGFLGPNGAGKSTTLKMLLGLVKPSAGKIAIFGKDFQQNRTYVLQHTGSLIESPSYYGHLTGLENLRIMQRLRDVPDKNITEVLKIVRLEQQKHKKVAHYSLGMKQRLGIAMALLAFPKLLILDEPTNGLDPGGIEEIRELIKSLPGQYGITVLLSSHLLAEIEQMATSVGIISNGQLLFQGRKNTLQEKSKNYIFLRTGNNEWAQNLLQQKGYHPVKYNEQLRLANLTDEEIARINKTLVQANLDVIRIEEHHKSLEDIFLELTRKENNLC